MAKFKVSKGEMFGVLSAMLSDGKSPDVFLLEGEVVEEKWCKHTGGKDYCSSKCALPPLPEFPLRSSTDIEDITDIRIYLRGLDDYLRARDGQK